MSQSQGEKKMKHQHFQSSWYDSHPLSFPTFRPAWSKSRVPDLGSMGEIPPFKHGRCPFGDGELPGAWMALAICSTVGPLMSHLLFPWESTSWPRDFWWDSFWFFGRSCLLRWGMDSSSLCTGTGPELVSIRNLGIKRKNVHVPKRNACKGCIQWWTSK